MVGCYLMHATIAAATPAPLGRCRDAVAAAGLDRVEVLTGDASTTTAYEGMVPCDLVLACGVFGHAADSDIENTIHRIIRWVCMGWCRLTFGGWFAVQRSRPAAATLRV